MAGLQLDEVLAEKFFNHVHPEIILRDVAGDFLPKNIRDERLQFIKKTAEMMKASPKFADLAFGKKGKLAWWISELFQEMQLSSLPKSR